MLRLLLDEDSMSRALLRALQQAGIATTTVAEQGRRGRGDEEQLEFAARGGWTLFTYNVGDFARLHATWLNDGREHAGIIVETNQYLHPGELVRRMQRLDATLSGSTMSNRLEYLGDFA